MHYKSHIAHKNQAWKLNQPSAPHHGGVEVCVKGSSRAPKNFLMIFWEHESSLKKSLNHVLIS